MLETLTLELSSSDMCNPDLKDDTNILKEISGSVSSRVSSN